MSRRDDRIQEAISAAISDLATGRDISHAVDRVTALVQRVEPLQPLELVDAPNHGSNPAHMQPVHSELVVPPLRPWPTADDLNVPLPAGTIGIPADVHVWTPIGTVNKTGTWKVTVSHPDDPEVIGSANHVDPLVALFDAQRRAIDAYREHEFDAALAEVTASWDDRQARLAAQDAAHFAHVDRSAET